MDKPSKLLQLRAGKHNLRETCIFKRTQGRTNAKHNCVTNEEAGLWNKYSNELKTC